MSKRGFFLVVAGVDCSGKTTNIPFIAEELRKQGHEVVTCRDPGGTPTAEKIRDLVLLENLPHDPIVPKTELLLFAASRRQLYDSFIKPNVDQGRVVICDRFFESTYAYQGYGKNLLHEVLTIEDELFSDVTVDAYLFFDVDSEVAEARKLARNKEYNRLNAHDREFHSKVHQGYQEWKEVFHINRINQIKGTHLDTIDANQKLLEVQKELINWIEHRFPEYFNDVRIRATGK